MNKRLKMYLFFCVFFAEISMAQTSIDSLILNSKKIDFENLKRLADIFYSKNHDCDSFSTGTTPELRYCLNMQLQREDSLLKQAVNSIIDNIKTMDTTDFDNTSFIKKIELTQEIWERYRYAYCVQCLSNFRHYQKSEVFSFLRCAIELTIKRREDIEKMCEY